LKEAGNLVRMREIEGVFPGVRAFNTVDFDLQNAEIQILAGANGAGKSTLAKILAGVYQKDTGSIWVEGKEDSIKSYKLWLRSL